jgi:cytochrome c biogenesis protein CcdA
MGIKSQSVHPRPAVQVRNVFAASVVALVTMSLAVYYGFIHPHAPMAGMSDYLSSVTLSAVVIGGLIDGINPCAFTVLLLFVSAMLATVQASSPEGIADARTRIIGMGSIYIAAVFLTYLALGVGLLATSALFSRFHAPARIGALLAIGMGLWMLKDVFLPDVGPRLAAPKVIGQWTVDAARKMTVPALVVGGFLIGLCTVPCSGAVYLGVLSLLSLLSLQSSALTGFGYLILYNLMFVLPLVALLVAASSRPTLNQLAHWNLHHKEWVRLALGASVVGMGLLILATV